MAKSAFVRLKRPKPKKKTEWRDYSSSRENRKRLSLGFGALIGLILLILLGRFVGFVADFLRPLDHGPIISQINFKTDHQINLVLKADSVGLMSYEPVDKTITVLKVPDEVFLSLPFNFGEYPARSVFELGQSENPPIGATLLSLGISQNMGVPIDGYLISEGQKTLEDLVESLRKDLLTSFKLEDRTVSNLSPYQILKLGFEIRGVRVDKVKFIDMERSAITEWKVLPDKSRALVFDNLQLDRFLQTNIMDSQISGESLNVSVFNATDHPGLALEAARQLSNIGVRVVVTDSWEEKLEKSIVIGEISYTKSRIEDLFTPDCQEGCVRIPRVSANPGSSDVNLILGEDFYNKYRVKP